MTTPRTEETVELLQAMIRNACVNDGTVESGQEVRTTDTLAAYLDGVGLDVEVYDAAPGRRSLAVRFDGSDPDAPSLCLDGHTDVVPVTPSGWAGRAPPEPTVGSAARIRVRCQDRWCLRSAFWRSNACRPEAGAFAPCPIVQCRLWRGRNRRTMGGCA